MTYFLCSSLDFSHDRVFLVATVMPSCFFKLVLRPSFSCHNNISVLVLVATLSCIIVISVATQKVCRDRVLLPLSLFPYCSFIFDAATWIFVLGMFCMSRTQYVMSRPSFSGRDITFLPSTYFRVAAHISCSDWTFLCSANLCCHNLVCYVAT